MQRNASMPLRHQQPGIVRRIVVWAFIIAVPWVPGGVALAMLVSSNAG